MCIYLNILYTKHSNSFIFEHTHLFCSLKLKSQFIFENNGSYSPKKAKKFFYIGEDSENNNNMYGFLCKRGFELLFAEAGKSVTPSAWSHPGNRNKAWATAF